MSADNSSENRNITTLQPFYFLYSPDDLVCV